MAEADPSLQESKADQVAAAPRRWGRLLLMLSVPLALLVGGFVYWQGLQGKVSTDNAYIQQDMVAVSSEVGGKIVEVRVREDQQVAAGDLLFRIDRPICQEPTSPPRARTSPSPSRSLHGKRN